MQPCHDAQHADLLLDGHAWQFATLQDAVTTYRKLRAYRGAQWPDFPATIRRLFAEASAAEQAWYQRGQARLGGLLPPQKVTAPAASASMGRGTPRPQPQARLLEDTP
jgi:hypothetical protein